jgi:hypothetical protein
MRRVEVVCAKHMQVREVPGLIPPLPVFAPTETVPIDWK